MADDNSFSLEGRGLKLDTAKDVEKHIAPLLASSAPSTIVHLNLSGNTIGVEAAKALAPHLSKLSSLRHANLADIFTSRLLSEIPPALDALLEALLPLKNLERVNLSDNAFGLNTQAPLVRFLERATPLRHLILNNNGLGPEAGTLIANALSKLAEAKASGEGSSTDLLQTIVCGRNRLENGSSTAWSKAFAAHASTLSEVKLSQNGIRVEGIQAILQGLCKANRLQTLDLQDNLFTLPCARRLVEVIGGWPKLKELVIEDTLLRRKGGVLLGQALAKGQNKELEVLRLQYNEVDIKGVEALVTALKADALPKLRFVGLNGNRFLEDDLAVEELRKILDERKEERGDVNIQEWGLDDLDELEEDDEDEDEDEQENADEATDEEEADEREWLATKEMKLADERENENVAQKTDASVDELADRLSKTEL